MLEGNLLSFKAVLHNWQQYECLAWFIRCRDGTGKLRAQKANQLTLNGQIGLIIRAFNGHKQTTFLYFEGCFVFKVLKSRAKKKTMTPL